MRADTDVRKERSRVDRNILTCPEAVVVVRVAYTRNLLSDEGSG